MKLVDARGMSCPKPVIEAKKALEHMDDSTLEVLVDNTAAVSNLMKLGNYMKVETESCQLGEHEYKVTFNRDNTAADYHNKIVHKTTETKQMLKGAKAGKAVVISADHMGEGDDVLGRLLMKGFIYGLTELEEIPETVLLYNGGAKLSVEGSDSLEDLRLLESQGAEILTCGTCLNHYGLTEKLAVGNVTTMYVICEKMMSASRLIKP